MLARTVRFALLALLGLHALIHLMGFVKAFELAAAPQLRTPIGRPLGVLWLVAALLLLGAVASWLVVPELFWIIGAAGLVASQVAIITAWGDARFGTLPNVALLLAVVYAAFAYGPFGLRAEYAALVRAGQASLAGSVHLSTPLPASDLPAIAEADLAALPAPVRRYLEYAGVRPGTERVRGFRVRMRGRIRGAADAPWMQFSAAQHSYLDPVRRYFFMEATRAGLPVDVLHVYDAAGASMRVRVLSLFPVVSVGGPRLRRTETVTVFNDLCVMAPAALVDPSIVWREVDERTVEATYTSGPDTVTATLAFGEDGALVDFWSDDRPALAPDGVTFTPQRWSTPLREYRRRGPWRLATRGEARYRAPSGDYAYIEFDDVQVDTDVGP